MHPRQPRDIDVALNEACKIGDVERARDALERGARVNAKYASTLGDMAPILFAASTGSVPLLELLCDNDCDVSMKSDFDETNALHHAASNAHLEAVKFLIDKGCDINHQDKLGRTPLMEAAEIGDTTIVDCLIESKVDVRTEDLNNFTALSYCVDFASQHEENFLYIAKKLIEAGDHPNRYGKFFHRTIIHSAAAQGDVGFIREMVEKKRARVHVKDADLKTPKDYAERNSKMEVVNYIDSVQDPEPPGPCCIFL